MLRPYSRLGDNAGGTQRSGAAVARQVIPQKVGERASFCERMLRQVGKGGGGGLEGVMLWSLC